MLVSMTKSTPDNREIRISTYIHYFQIAQKQHDIFKCLEASIKKFKLNGEDNYSI